jgi:transcriptional regulator with XRE-family HTH domain
MKAFDPSRLVSYRRELGLSQRALSTKAGVTQSVIAELERGKHPPSANSLNKLAGALGVKPSDLCAE